MSLVQPKENLGVSKAFPIVEVALGGLLAILFAPTIVGLAYTWEHDPNYSHGYLILPLSLFLAWRYWRDHSLPETGEPVLGGVSLASGFVFHALALVSGYPPLDFVAMVLVLRGLTVLLGGREWARGFLFPIFFLFFMFPVPFGLVSSAALWLQELVSAATTGVLDLFFVCFRRGNNIYLAGVAEPLQVAEECSGLRQIMAFLALGTLVGYFSGQGAWFRILLVAAALPIAFLANVVRVLLMAFSLHFFGSGSIAGWRHDLLGILPVPLGLLLFFLVVRGLTWAFQSSSLEEVPT